MKLTYNWLKDFVGIKLDPHKLADRLTMAGLEVKSVEARGGDFVFEIEITSNRPDWLSVVGVAREVAAITKTQVARHKSQDKIKAKKSPLKIEIENKKDCSFYSAKIFKGIKVGQSPAWLRERLELIGCRSINNIVDITNYILFTYGEPLHAFDLDKLNSDTVVVRRAKNGEKIISIDAIERQLDKDTLVIANKERPVAVAGIMGGKDTEVGFGTKNMLLEAAIFDQVLVRRASRKLGLQSDSSYRFERGLDFRTAVKGSAAAAALIVELAGAEEVSEKDTGSLKAKEKTVVLDVGVANKTLGIDRLSQAETKNILTHLGFGVKTQSKHKLSVKVPLFRQDVNSATDLIEEVARIYGYEKIPSTLAKASPEVRTTTPRDLAILIKNMLLGLGLHEAITYSLIDRALLKGFPVVFEAVEIMNPLSKEQEILRPILSPSLVKCISYNLNQKQPYVNLFEIANVFLRQDKLAPIEKPVLSIGLCGERAVLLEKGLLKEKMGLLHLKGIFESLFDRLGIKDYLFEAGNAMEASIILGKNKIGFMRKLDNAALDVFDIKNKEVVIAEIFLEELFSRANMNKKFTLLPLYPGVSRDVSFVIKENVKTEEILAAIRREEINLLREVNVVDVYKGKQIPPDSRSLTVSCLYRSGERTLTEEEINPLHERVCHVLIEKFSAQIR